MNPYNTRINQGRPYNPDFNNQIPNPRNLNNMGAIHNPTPNNFYPPNPNFAQPMPQNNPLGVIQMLASQIQSNPQLQLNLFSQLQSQNFGATFNPGVAPFMGPHNHMLGMQNAQMFPQSQIYQGNQMPQMNLVPQGNQMHQGNQMMGYPGFGSVPNNMRQSQGIQNTTSVAKQVNHYDNRTTKTPHSFGKQSSNSRFQKSQTPDKRNLNGNMKQLKRRGGRGGNQHLGVKKQSSVDFSEKGPTIPKRSIFYITTETKLWLQARKKNFPTKANIEKKKARQNKNIEDADAKLRRQQLKEVLQKQAELGVEVAEIPGKYLEEESKETKADEVSYKKQRSRGGRYGKSRCKRRKPNNDAKEEANPSRETSLLKKLLSADIKRDKLRLLQVFRFMVSNNFFKNSPETPLVFPTVVLKESTLLEDVEIIEEEDDDEEANQNLLEME